MISLAWTRLVRYLSIADLPFCRFFARFTFHFTPEIFCLSFYSRIILFLHPHTCSRSVELTAAATLSPLQVSRTQPTTDSCTSSLRLLRFVPLPLILTALIVLLALPSTKALLQSRRYNRHRLLAVTSSCAHSHFHAVRSRPQRSTGSLPSKPAAQSIVVILDATSPLVRRASERARRHVL